MAQANVATLPVVHEDLSDELVLLEPEEMVFASIVRMGKPAENDIYYGPADSRLSTGLGGIADGVSVTRSAVTNQQANRGKIPGVIQHFRETHGVSTLAQVVMNPAGIEDAFADGRVKALIATKQDMEWTFLSQQEQQEGSTTVSFLTRGASRWGDATAQPNLPVPTAFRPASNQVVAKTATTDIAERDIRTMLQNLRTSRKRPIKAQGFCTFDMGTRFDDYFTSLPTADSALPVRQFVSQGDADSYEIGITRYKTRFGTLDIVPTAYLNATQNLAYSAAASGTTAGTGSTAGASTTNTSTTVAFTSTLGMQPFQKIAGTGIPAAAYIVSITDATHVVISAAATATGTPTVTIGEGDHCLFLDMEFYEVRQNKAPSAYELAPDGSGRQGVVEAIGSLFCGYPAVMGKFNH